MHLFSHERPVLATCRPTLLNDGSAVPDLTLHPVTSDRVSVRVMLRQHDAAGGYAWHEREMPLDFVASLLRNYIRDPEAVLSVHFGWQAALPAAFAGNKVAEPGPEALVNSEDLL